MPGAVPDRPPPLARVAGLPPDVLAGLASPATAADIAAVLRLDEWLAVEGTALADLLYGPVGGAPSALRPRLVGLRRALHAGRPPARSEWDDAVAAAVPAGTAARVRCWVAQAARRRELIDALPSRLAADSAATVAAVREAVADPGFRRALVRSSPTLDAAVERWLAGGGPPRRQVLLRLARYLARAATKTSPYGTFTVTGPGRWTPSGPAVHLALGAAGTPVTLLELDELLLDAVQRQLQERPELVGGLPLRVSPGAVAVGGSVVFLGPAPAEPVVTAGCTDAVRTCIQAAGAGTDRDRVVAALVEAGGEPGRAPAYVDRLVRLGVLEVCRPVPAGTPDPLLALADRLAAGSPLAGALRRLHAELVRPVPLADLAGQRDRQRALGREAAEVAAEAGLAGAATTAVRRPEAVAYEHALAAGPLLDCGWPAWRPLLADLAGLRRWSAVHDPALPLRLVLGDWVAARFGVGARVPFVLLHRAVRQEAGGTPIDPLGAELARWLDAPGGLPDPDGVVPRLAELRALRLAAAAPLAAEPGPDGVLRLAALAPGPWPAWVGDAGAATCYVQPVPGGVVLNTMTVGYGRGRTRVCHLAGRAGLDWALGPPAVDGEPVEISGSFGTALDVRAPATRREVVYPGTESTRPPADRIPLGVLVAAHDPATGLVRLLDRAGTPVRPVHLGLLVEALLPAAARLLVRLAGGTVLPPGWTDPRPARVPAGPDAVAYAPRVVVGQVTLRRARWLVRAAALVREPGEGDAAHLLRLARWRRRHGIPDRAFLHAGGPAAVTGPVFDKTRKPLYVDWRSAPLTATAERYLRGAAELVAIEEALPDPATGERAVELLVDLPGEPRVAEPGWVSAHVFHQGDLDALLVGAVHPVVAGLAADWFFLRHWEGGLHVRLRVRPTPSFPAAELRDRIVAGCGPWLAAHPSTHRISPAEYAASAAKFAVLEGAERWETVQREPDGIAFVPYAPGALDRHQVESSRLALDLLRSAPAIPARDTAALALLLLAWFTAEPDPARLAPRVAGDASPPDPTGGSPALWRAAVDRRYRDQRERLLGLAGRMRAVAADPDRPGLFADWTASVRAVAAGADDPLSTLDRCAHLVCNRLGVSLVEEGYLRVLAARTVHALAGVPV